MQQARDAAAEKTREHTGVIMENKKKAVAAAAAVIEYIAAEEDALRVQSVAGAMPAPVAGAAGPVKLWGISGRQAQMQMRNMMQMRAFK